MMTQSMPIYPKNNQLIVNNATLLELFVNSRSHGMLNDNKHDMMATRKF